MDLEDAVIGVGELEVLGIVRGVDLLFWSLLFVVLFLGKGDRGRTMLQRPEILSTVTVGGTAPVVVATAV